MAYGQVYDCPHVMLLYPHHAMLPPNPILQRYSITMPDAKESLFVATLDVTGSHRTHEAALRALVLDRLDTPVVA